MDERARLDRKARQAAGPNPDPVRETEAALYRAALAGNVPAAVAYLAAHPEKWGRFAEPAQEGNSEVVRMFQAIAERMARRAELATLPAPVEGAKEVQP